MLEKIHQAKLVKKRLLWKLYVKREFSEPEMVE